MVWDGKERRSLARAPDGTFYCDAHGDTQTALALLGNKFDNVAISLDKIDKHLESSAKGRTGVWIAVISVLAVWIVQAAFVIFEAGIMMRQIDVDTIRINTLETEFRQINDNGTPMLRQRVDELEKMLGKK